MIEFDSAASGTWPPRLARAGAWTVACGVLLAAAAGPLHRFGIAGPMPALLVLVAGACLVVAGGLMAMSGLLLALNRGLAIQKGRAIAAIVVALGLGAYLASWLLRTGDVPLLHEITTDFESPPPFVAIRALREADGATNPPEYVTELKGPKGLVDVPEGQRSAYPDIQPLLLPLTVEQAFARAEAAVRQLGWEVVASEPAEGRIEATDTTFFFGFKDDVVVRIRADPNGSRVDVRSKSRVGLGDAGANAKRVRALLALLAGNRG